MSNTLKQLSSGQLAATAATLYTCPTGMKARILAATATNDTTTAVTYTLYIVPSGDSAGVANLVCNAQPLNDSESNTVNEIIGHVLEPGDTLQGLASTADQVTLTVSGVEVT